jgi:hypothetical protein
LSFRQINIVSLSNLLAHFQVTYMSLFSYQTKYPHAVAVDQFQRRKI